MKWHSLKCFAKTPLRLPTFVEGNMEWMLKIYIYIVFQCKRRDTESYTKLGVDIKKI